MKILIVVGARPNFMKAAPILKAIERHNASNVPAMDAVLVHTGQHYDAVMSDRFFDDLNLRKPDIQLGVGSGSHALQTAEIMKRFESVLHSEKPNVMIVVGDVNSTLACALVAAKISTGNSVGRPLIAHVEAGLRSFDRDMPEEVNRVITDHLSDVLFVTERSGLHNLKQEGVPLEKIHFVGNTMIDSLLSCRAKANQSMILDELGLRRRGPVNGSDENVGPYILLTLHRPSNVDRLETFRDILDAIEESSDGRTVIFPVHPRTQKRVEEFGLDSRFTSPDDADVVDRRMRMIGPLGYVDFLWLMSNAKLVVTDSGGVQEETTCLGVPCVTVRDTTERPVTVDVGTNVLAGLKKENIRAAVTRQLNTKQTGQVPPYWDGQTGKRIVEVLEHVLKARGSQSGARAAVVSGMTQ